ncbi:MAG: RNA polymerase sigma factor, partial [Anaerolineales bacterium]|nr:RNA polymerase sigma factor [Anaerolineales bacterium]
SMLTFSIIAHNSSSVTAGIDAHDFMDEQERDLQLVTRMAAGENQALEALYALYGQRMVALALRLTRNPAQAEDVVQDALIAAWRSAKRYRGDGRVIAWLLGIVHHTACKSLRRKTMPLTETIEETITASHPLPEEQVQANEQAHLIQQGLQSLSPNHRVVLELVFYQELSLKETARVVKCPVGTVKSRLNYARRHLRGILSRQIQEKDWR